MTRVQRGSGNDGIAASGDAVADVLYVPHIDVEAVRAQRPRQVVGDLGGVAVGGGVG